MKPGKPLTYASPIPPGLMSSNLVESREDYGWLATRHENGDQDSTMPTYQDYPCRTMLVQR